MTNVLPTPEVSQNWNWKYSRWNNPCLGQNFHVRSLGCRMEWQRKGMEKCVGMSQKFLEMAITFHSSNRTCQCAKPRVKTHKNPLWLDSTYLQTLEPRETEWLFWYCTAHPRKKTGLELLLKLDIWNSRGHGTASAVQRSFFCLP